MSGERLKCRRDERGGSAKNRVMSNHTANEGEWKNGVGEGTVWVEPVYEGWVTPPSRPGCERRRLLPAWQTSVVWWGHGNLLLSSIAVRCLVGRREVIECHNGGERHVWGSRQPRDNNVACGRRSGIR